MKFAILNLIIIIVSYLGLAITYLISLTPKKREKKLGKKVWNQSKQLRTAGFLFEMAGIITTILWKWYPVSFLDWKIGQNPTIGLMIGLIGSIPCLIIMIIGVIHAGKESWEPSPDTNLHGGIYKYIRHPQAIGEFPFFIFLAFIVNSWFLVIFLTVYNIIYLPIMTRIEEADLIRRFGDEYRKYQEKTGKFLPKFSRK